MGHGHFLNSTGDKGGIKRQRHVTLAFLKIDMRHQDPPSRAPALFVPFSSRWVPNMTAVFSGILTLGVETIPVVIPPSC